MSWLRRLFGSDGDGEQETIGADELGYATNPQVAATAKGELIRVLRARGARSAILVYDGGHDEGGVTEIFLSSAPLADAPEAWREGTLPDAEEIDMERAWDAWGAGEDADEETRRLSELMDAAEALIAAKWEGFAGEFEVQGRLVVDVEGERVARHDVVTLDEEYGGDTTRETETI